MLKKLSLTVTLLVALGGAAGQTAYANKGNGLTKHDKDVIKFFQHHPQQAHTSVAGQILAKILPKALRTIRSLQAAKVAKAAYAALHALPDGVCGSCWDNVAACESGGGGPPNWGINTGNGFYWGLQWVPSTWDSTAARHGLPSFNWFASNNTYPTREQQITAASDLSLSNWPVCGARY